MAAQEPFVLVGGGLAAAKAAETLRSDGYVGPVVLVGAIRTTTSPGTRCTARAGDTASEACRASHRHRLPVYWRAKPICRLSR